MYYKKSHRAWYVNIHGKSVRLGTTEDEARASHAQLTGDMLKTVGEVITKFLARPMSEGNRSFYAHSLKGLPNVPLADLKPFHVTGCRNVLRAAKTCFRWCEKQGYIGQSPLRNLELPPATGRGDEVYLTNVQVAQLMDRCPPDMLDLLVTLHETGCRPQEVRRKGYRVCGAGGRQAQGKDWHSICRHII